LERAPLSVARAGDLEGEIQGVEREGGGRGIQGWSEGVKDAKREEYRSYSSYQSS